MFYSKYLDENRNYFTFTTETNTSQFNAYVTAPWPNKYDWFHKPMAKNHVCIASTMSCKQ